jgi:glycosyltransferase involved in cell wall biosynthesis
VDPDPANAYNNRCTMIKMMEYMAFEKPIVAFDLPEHRVTAEQAAIYVTPNDELAFARALDQLMNDAPRRRVMGACGRQRIETTLAWHFSISKLLEVYRKVLPKALLAHQSALSEANQLRSRTVSCGRAN